MKASIPFSWPTNLIFLLPPPDLLFIPQINLTGEASKFQFKTWSSVYVVKSLTSPEFSPQFVKKTV